jgi:hypothetical protein
MGYCSLADLARVTSVSRDDLNNCVRRYLPSGLVQETRKGQSRQLSKKAAFALILAYRLRKVGCSKAQICYFLRDVLDILWVSSATVLWVDASGIRAMYDFEIDKDKLGSCFGLINLREVHADVSRAGEAVAPIAVFGL